MPRLKAILLTMEMLAVANIALIGTRAFAGTFIYNNFASTAGLILKGYAKPVDGKLRIAPAIGGQGRGGVWLDSKEPVEAGFDTTFQIQITDKYVYGADGLAFVIQDPAPMLGAAGRNICYGGLTNMVATKFDDYHWQNHVFAPFDEIAVLAAASPTTPLWDTRANALASVAKSVVFSDGQVHTVRILYVPGNLQIFLDDLEHPAMTTNVNLDQLMNLDNGRAWVGFTAASGADWQNHDLIRWGFHSPALINEFRMPPEPIGVTNPIYSPAPRLRADEEQIRANRLLIDPGFGYRLPSNLGLPKQIEVSTNLVDWEPLTNAAFYFRDPGSTNYPQRFYRFEKD